MKLSYETILLDTNEYFLTKNINWYVKKDIMIRLKKKKTKLTFVYSLFIHVKKKSNINDSLYQIREISYKRHRDILLVKLDLRRSWNLEVSRS